MSALTKVWGKGLPQLYYMIMKICYVIYMFFRHRSYRGNVMTPLRILLTFVFFGNRTIIVLNANSGTF